MNGNRRSFLGLASSAVAAGLAGVYPYVLERYDIHTNRYVIPVPNLPSEFAGLTIVQLTDIHHGTLLPTSIVQSLVERVNRLEKDITVCTGDYIHEQNATEQIDSVWPVLGSLRASGGVYSVLGNHDHWGSTSQSLYWLERSGQGIRHKAVPVERGGKRIWLAGAGDLWEDHLGLDTILRDVPEKDCRIVLAHNPDTADTDFESRVDLVLSGHTHGGQVRLPIFGAPVLPVRNKTYSSGLKTSLRGTPVFISRGVGCAVVPVRFNCAPEIAVLELVPAFSNA